MIMATNSRIYDFNWSNKKRKNNFKELLTYPPILKGLIFILIIASSIYILNISLVPNLSYLLVLASPFITVTLMHLKEGYSALNYENRLKSALINEIISNLHSIKSNEYILNYEFEELKKGAISTDPLVKMVWDEWDIIKFHYASKHPDYNLNIVYDYIRGLYVINEAITERQLYTIIHISSREEYNKLILGLNSQLIPEITASLETLNAKMFIFNDNITIDEVASTLNDAEIPMPIEVKPYFQKPLDELVIIVNQNGIL